MTLFPDDDPFSADAKRVAEGDDPFTRDAKRSSVPEESSADHDPFEALAEPVPKPSGTKKFGHLVRAPKDFAQQLGELMEYGDPEMGGGRPKRTKPPDHNARTFAYLRERGLVPTREEHWVTLRNGQGIKVDKYGLWDFSFRDPDPDKPIGYVQAVTGEKGLQVHMRNMTSSRPAFDNKRPRLENLLWCLAQGYYLGILVFERHPNGRNWDKRMVRVTREMVDGYLARKRK